MGRHKKSDWLPNKQKHLSIYHNIILIFILFVRLGTFQLLLKKKKINDLRLACFQIKKKKEIAPRPHHI